MKRIQNKILTGVSLSISLFIFNSYAAVVVAPYEHGHGLPAPHCTHTHDLDDALADLAEQAARTYGTPSSDPAVNHSFDFIGVNENDGVCSQHSMGSYPVKGGLTQSTNKSVKENRIRRLLDGKPYRIMGDRVGPHIGHKPGYAAYNDAMGCPARFNAPLGLSVKAGSSVIGFGNYVHRIRLHCGEVQSNGTVSADTGAIRTIAGTNSVSGQKLGLCNSNEVMTGITARGDIYLDQIQSIRCTQISTKGNLSTHRTVSINAGGAGGKLENLFCPENTALHGLNAKKGQWIDAIELTCGTVLKQPPVSQVFSENFPRKKFPKPIFRQNQPNF